MQVAPGSSTKRCAHVCMGATVALLAIQSAVALCLHKNVNIHIVTILWIYRDVRESYTQTSSHSSRLFMSSTCCHS